MVKITEFCNPGNVTAGMCNTAVGTINPYEGNVVIWSDYGYTVVAWAAYLFIALFGLVTVLHILIASVKRNWWILFTVALGAAIETIGWGGRVMSVTSIHWNENLGGFWEYDDNSFIIQVVCLIIAPVFFSAANYILLGKLINTTGGHYCLITSKSFAIVFMFFDFICLVIQAAGGGMAATSDDQQGSDNGAYIMTGGVVLQLVVTAAFIVLLVDFVRRYRARNPVVRQKHILPNWRFLGRNETPFTNNDISMNSVNSSGQITPPTKMEVGGEAGPSGTSGYTRTATENTGVLGSEITERSVWIMVGLLVSTSVLIVVRSIYRSAELTNGWDGSIATNQPLFLGLDALLMAILTIIYVPISPAFFLPRMKL